LECIYMCFHCGSLLASISSEIRDYTWNGNITWTIGQPCLYFLPIIRF
jgi:hypothetical protein